MPRVSVPPAYLSECICCGAVPPEAAVECPHCHKRVSAEVWDIVEDLRARIEELEGEVEDLKAHVEEGERGSVSGTDPRDQAVLDVLQRGAEYTAPQLISIFHTETDIRRQKTAKRRVKALTKSDAFERSGRRWRFVGGEDDG